MQPKARHSICYKCDYEGSITLIHCPQCGRLLHTDRQVRRSGWVLAGIGAILALFMSGLIILIAYIMAQSANPESTTRFSGTRLEAAMIFAILGLVWMFGLTALAGGIWQIKYGRRNRRLIQVILLLGFAFFAVGLLIQLFD
jgi:hypothetical protein